MGKTSACAKRTMVGRQKKTCATHKRGTEKILSGEGGRVDLEYSRCFFCLGGGLGRHKLKEARTLFFWGKGCCRSKEKFYIWMGM